MVELQCKKLIDYYLCAGPKDGLSQVSGVVAKHYGKPRIERGGIVAAGLSNTCLGRQASKTGSCLQQTGEMDGIAEQ